MYFTCLDLAYVLDLASDLDFASDLDLASADLDLAFANLNFTFTNLDLSFTNLDLAFTNLDFVFTNLNLVFTDLASAGLASVDLAAAEDLATASHSWFSHSNVREKFPDKLLSPQLPERNGTFN